VGDLGELGHPDARGHVLAVVELAALEEGVGGPPQAEGVEGLEHPPVGVAAAGEEDVVTAVEEHQHRAPGQAAGPLLEAQRHAGRHAPHVPDLEVEHDQVGVELAHRGDHLAARVDPVDRGLLVAEGGVELVVDPVGIGGQEHHGHGAGGYPSARSAAKPPVATIWPLLSITVEPGDAYTLCRPEGELDAYTVSRFREALAELTESQQLLIDLSDVPFMDSAGLGALIGGIRRAREAGGDVAVACGRPTLTRLLHTTGFDRIVAVTETVDQAAAALAEGKGDPEAGSL
jgi:anti-sigma B factor antagonist